MRGAETGAPIRVSGYQYGWDATCGGLVQPTHYTRYEGGPWIEWPSSGRIDSLPPHGSNDRIKAGCGTGSPRFHSLRFRCGAEWDTANGWRRNKATGDRFESPEIDLDSEQADSFLVAEGRKFFAELHERRSEQARREFDALMEMQ